MADRATSAAPAVARTDQAEGLRRLLGRNTARVIALESAAAGVGKTSIAINVAAALATRGLQVLLLDGSVAAGNISTLLGLRSRFDLHDALDGTCAIDDVLLHGPAGVMVLPAGGALRYGHSARERERFDAKVMQLAPRFDYVLVDAGAVPGEAALGKAIERNLDCVPMMSDAFLASGAKPSDLLVSRACRLTDAPSVKKMFDATGGATPAMMDIAVGTNDAYMVNVLLKAGVVPSEGTLETAVESRPAEWVETFIRAGSKPTADMMDIAVRNRNRHTVNVLLAAKIIPSEKALALAVENKLADWAQVFIKVGAKPTPAMMDTAIRNSDLATIAVLSKAFAALPKPAPAPAENPILRAEQKPPQPRLVLRRPKAG